MIEGPEGGRSMAPMSIAGVGQEAFFLHGVCLKYVPDWNVCFEMKVGPKGKRIPLARYEWRSLREGHTNSRRKGSPCLGSGLAEPIIIHLNLTGLRQNVG